MTPTKSVNGFVRRNHGMYLWLTTEMHTLLDDFLATSTQYDWLNNEQDKEVLFQLFERDIKRIANHVATNPEVEKETL